MMLLDPVDAYCERLDATLWSEPVNAATNLAFVLAAWWMWRRVQGPDLALARALCGVLAGIGLASGLFHTLAVGWTGAADSLSILIFVLLYLCGANRAFWRLRPLPALVLTAAFLPYAALLVPLFMRLSWLGGSAAYMPVPLLIAAYALALRRRAPETARGLAIGAALLLVSLGFRTLDGPLCPVWPLGTHWLWHLLNAAMLAWMIEVWRRHVTARIYPGSEPG